MSSEIAVYISSFEKVLEKLKPEPASKRFWHHENSKTLLNGIDWHTSDRQEFQDQVYSMISQALSLPSSIEYLTWVKRASLYV